VNWRQAAGEAFLLFLGVLFALAGQAWWETRSERETIRDYSANLLVEVRENTAGLERTIKRLNEKVEKAVTLLRLMEDADPEASNERIRALISELTYFDDFRPATSALDNLVGAGGLGLLDNAELQLAVSKYAQAIDDHNVLQVELADFFWQELIVFLSERSPLLQLTFADRNIPDPRPRGGFELDLAMFMESLQFENLVVRRITADGDAARFAQRLLGAAEELIPLLEGIK
jgi:hypothetical protein